MATVESTSSRWRIGTMSFSYTDWRGIFYPPELKPSDFLGFYAQHFDALELDSTFHAIPARQVLERWADVVPSSFRFTAKAPKAITHDGIVADAAGPMRDFVTAMKPLGEKLAVVLIQYPPVLPSRVWPQMERFLANLPAGPRYAIEFRNASWDRDEVYRGLEKLNICLVNAEYTTEPKPPVITTDFAYVRLVGQHGRYEPMNFERWDPTDRLRWWHTSIEQTRTNPIYCMVNNDYAGFSIASADKLKAIVGQAVSTPSERLGTLF